MTIRKWIGLEDWGKLASALKKRYPRGTAGERGELASQLVTVDKVAFREAVGAAAALEEEGYAHHLPGEKGRWVFTSQPVSLRELMTEFVGRPEELHEAAGYTSVTYDPDRQRDHMLISFSEAFRGV